jgi:hypothetical protein
VLVENFQKEQRNQVAINNCPGRWANLLHETDLPRDFYLCEYGNEIHEWRSLRSIYIVLDDAEKTVHKSKACLGPERKKTREDTFRVRDKNMMKAGCRWLTPVVLATQEAEIRRIIV